MKPSLKLNALMPALIVVHLLLAACGGDTTATDPNEGTDASSNNGASDLGSADMGSEDMASMDDMTMEVYEEDDPVPDPPTSTNTRLADLGDAGKFLQEDTERFVNNFEQITSDSYVLVDDETAGRVPEGLDACRAQGPQTEEGEVTLTAPTPTVMNSAEVAAECGETNKCVIGENVTVEIDGPLKVYALTVNGGAVVWNDQTQQAADVWLCAGYAVVEDGSWDMNLQNRDKRAWRAIHR